MELRPRRYSAFLLIIFTFLSLGIFHVMFEETPVVAQTQQEFFPFVGEITSDNVNVRAGQSANFPKLIQLQSGDQVIVTDHRYSWYQIRLPQAARSFISTKYIEKVGGSPHGRVSGSKVNIRSGPSVDASIIGHVVEGDIVTILEEAEEGWYRIEPIQESHGWVYDTFISFVSKDLTVYAGPGLPEEPQITSEELEPVVAEPEPVEPEKAAPLLVKGRLEPAADVAEGISYRLTVDGQTVYYIQGFSGMLDSFLRYEVEVEGEVVPSPSETIMLPVIKAGRVQLVL